VIVVPGKLVNFVVAWKRGGAVSFRYAVGLSHTLQTAISGYKVELKN
jgi:hypothetical protein